MEKLIKKIIEHYEDFREPYKQWGNNDDVAHAIFESLKPEIKKYLNLVKGIETCDFCDKPMTNKVLRTCDEHSINRRM